MTFSDGATDSVLGVRAFMERLAPVSQAGRDRIGELRFYGPDDDEAWREEMARLAEAERWCEAEPSGAEAARAALSELPLIERPLRKLGVDGVLGEAELFTIKRFLYYGSALCEAAIDLLEDWGVAEGCPEALRELMEAIHPQRRATPRFHLASELSDELEACRVELRGEKRREHKLRDAIERAVAADHGGTFDVHGTFRPGTDTSESVLDGDQRLQKTHVGWKLADADLGAVRAEIERLQEEIEAIEFDIRARLSETLAERVDWLEEIAEHLARLDVRLAKVALRADIDGCWPQRREQPGVTIEAGREPGVARLLAERAGEDIQPVDIDIGQAPVVITGPNMGGKSVLLRLVGICQWCAQHALPAPAARCAFSPVASIVYVGSEEPGVRQAAQGLSSFGREVRRLVDWWDAPDGRRLWLLDEIGRGTHPDEGADIACAVIDELARRGESVVAATHFPRVASLEGAAKLRIAGLTEPDRLEELLARDDLDVEAALRRAMDFRPLSVEAHDVPRDARVVAKTLGLEIE